MNLVPELLGTTTVRKLEESQRATVLKIGRDVLTRADLARVGCYNFLAARLLSHVLEDQAIAGLQELYDKIPPAALTLPHLGVVSLAVLGAAFECKGIGGKAPLESYARKHAMQSNGTAGTIVTFDTLKNQARKREAERTPRRRRRRG